MLSPFLSFPLTQDEGPPSSASANETTEAILAADSPTASYKEQNLKVELPAGFVAKMVHRDSNGSEKAYSDPVGSGSSELEAVSPGKSGHTAAVNTMQEKSDLRPLSQVAAESRSPGELPPVQINPMQFHSTSIPADTSAPAATTAPAVVATGEQRVKRIGRYTLCMQTLGKGNFARVELARHSQTQAKVVSSVSL